MSAVYRRNIPAVTQTASPPSELEVTELFCIDLFVLNFCLFWYNTLNSILVIHLDPQQRRMGRSLSLSLKQARGEERI